MKTIEEKAKAYDGIIERAKTMLAAGEVMYGKENNASQLITDIIPELRESEDERIRKEIISALKFANDGGVYDKHIAYLEKQEQKPISAVEVLARAGLKPYKDGNQWCILAGDNIQEGICGFGDTIEDALYEFLKEILDLQKEQKPISSCDIVPYIDDAIAALQDMWREEKVAFDWDDMHEMIEDVARHFYQKEQKPLSPDEKMNHPLYLEGFDVGREVGKVEAEQKPAWSEEDQLNLNWVIAILNGEPCDLDIQLESLITWLKSLRPDSYKNCNSRLKPSEEEKDNISILLCMIDSMDSISLPSGTLRITGEKRRELKEFINRPSWKPSRVQMSMLLAVINDPNNASSESCRLALAGLYEELKQK